MAADLDRADRRAVHRPDRHQYRVGADRGPIRAHRDPVRAGALRP